jgi:hypothetical protein
MDRGRIAQCGGKDSAEGEVNWLRNGRTIIGRSNSLLRRKGLYRGIDLLTSWGMGELLLGKRVIELLTEEWTDYYGGLLPVARWGDKDYRDYWNCWLRKESIWIADWGKRVFELLTEEWASYYYGGLIPVAHWGGKDYREYYNCWLRKESIWIADWGIGGLLWGTNTFSSLRWQGPMYTKEWNIVANLV